MAFLIGSNLLLVDLAFTSEQSTASCADGFGQSGSTKCTTSEYGAALLRSCLSISVSQVINEDDVNVH
jgi:hypothetical protein